MDEQPLTLELTGERTLPGFRGEEYWFARHLVAYELAAKMAVDRTVFDIGCGEGYGAAMISDVAGFVTGVDIAPEVMTHAHRKYVEGGGRKNLSFEVMDVNRLSIDSRSADLVVSFQVVEHLVDRSCYFAEIGRILHPEGTAMITTPNRLTISPGSETPINPFHLHEYTPGELEEALLPYFGSVEILGMAHRGWLAVNERLKLVDFIKVYEMGKYNPRFWTHRLLTPLVRPRHFSYAPGSLDRSLDILAVCRFPASDGAA